MHRHQQFIGTFAGWYIASTTQPVGTFATRMVRTINP